MGECPEWYPTLKAAEKAGLPLLSGKPLLRQPAAVRNMYLIMMAAEMEAKRILAQRSS